MARILVAEPSGEVRHLFDRVLPRLGHEVVPFDRDRETDPADIDAVLLDPDAAGGVELAERLRARDPALPVVACSIYPRDERTAPLGPVGLLLKPFTRAELERAIVEALEGTLAVWPTTPTA